jgi:hypothetical protein
MNEDTGFVQKVAEVSVLALLIIGIFEIVLLNSSTFST